VHVSEEEKPLLGRWVSDLEVGDVLGPIEQEVTPFLIREYAHATEDRSERHHDPSGMIAPPTILHGHKARLLEQSCPEGSGPSARLHLVYDATYHRMIPASRVLSIEGEVAERYERKGREHLVITFEVRDKKTGEVYTRYRDTSLLNFQPGV
jgi:hypothetical protein